MAKAKPSGSTQKGQKNRNAKMRQTVYVSKQVNRLLWINRFNTGKSASQAVEELVLKHLKEEKIKA